MKTAIVSGGSSGIGAALCARLQQQGWHVVSLSRRAPALAGVEHVAIDLAAPAWPEPALARLQAQAGGPLALVHNAGAFAHDSAANMDEDYLAHAFRLMVMAPARLNKLLAPMLLPGSSIVYVGSTLSAIAVPHACSYTLLKHAVVGMMRATQQDFSGRGVHSCCICPGFTATPMLQDNKSMDQSLLARRVSFGRLLAAGEVAALVQVCIQSPALNGAVLHANLGQINC